MLLTALQPHPDNCGRISRLLIYSTQLTPTCFQITTYVKILDAAHLREDGLTMVRDSNGA